MALGKFKFQTADSRNHLKLLAQITLSCLSRRLGGFSWRVT